MKPNNEPASTPTQRKPKFISKGIVMTKEEHNKLHNQAPTQRQHTNPPWAYTKKPSKSYSDHGMREICNTGDFMVYIPKERLNELLNASEANASHIVKCVNEYDGLVQDLNLANIKMNTLLGSHEQLVEALKSLVSRATQSEENMSIYKKAKEVLASAQKEG